jgi:tetratricopeptide (TPR) repeat protein
VPNKHVRLLAAVAVLCLCGSAWGLVSEADSVKGEIHTSGVLRGQVTLSDLHGGLNVFAVPVGGDGRFEFRHVPYGDYRLTVLNSAEQPLHEELIAVHNQQQPIEIQLTVREEPRPASGSISAAELLHPPTKKAFKAFVTAQSFSDAGEHEKAVEELEKAVQLSPAYAAAWTNLGAQRILLKQYEQAIQDLTHAGEVSRPSAMILSNISYAQYMLHRSGVGTATAREALRLDPSYVQAHYLLGFFLLQDRQTRAEGVEHLELAARTMPAARAELDRVSPRLSAAAGDQAASTSLRLVAVVDVLFK